MARPLPELHLNIISPSARVFEYLIYAGNIECTSNVPCLTHKGRSTWNSIRGFFIVPPVTFKTSRGSVLSFFKDVSSSRLGILGSATYASLDVVSRDRLRLSIGDANLFYVLTPSYLHYYWHTVEGQPLPFKLPPFKFCSKFARYNSIQFPPFPVRQLSEIAYRLLTKCRQADLTSSFSLWTSSRNHAYYFS